MTKNLRYLGLDVHAETIAVALAEPGGEVRSLGIIPNEPSAVAKLVRKLGGREQLRACYEAGPCGYVLYWQLTKLGVACDVVAPTLVPTKPGDRVKTDRRDAEKLARCHRAGDLTAVWVPDAAHEALRDLVRARAAAKADQLRAPHPGRRTLLTSSRLLFFHLADGRGGPLDGEQYSRTCKIEHAQNSANICRREGVASGTDDCIETRGGNIQVAVDRTVQAIFVDAVDKARVDLNRRARPRADGLTYIEVRIGSD